MRNGASWKKKEKACTDEERKASEDHGDQWDHVVIDAESKAVIAGFAQYTTISVGIMALFG